MTRWRVVVDTPDETVTKEFRERKDAVDEAIEQAERLMMEPFMTEGLKRVAEFNRWSWEKEESNTVVLLEYEGEGGGWWSWDEQEPEGDSLERKTV